MNRSVNHFYEFGPYRLDAADGLLLREGQHVPLTPKAYETLRVLVESGGHVVEKEELIKKIWPDTFVEEVNLAKNISNLRKILGGEESNQYIQTIPKRGYRFVASVKEVWDPPESSRVSALTASVNGKQAGGTEESRPQFDLGLRGQNVNVRGAVGEAHAVLKPLTIRVGWPIALFVLCLCAAGVWFVLSHRRSESPALPMKIVPFTSFQGRESHPAFSPDGDRIAFVWDGETGDNPDIYVQSIGASQPQRLTTSTDPDTHPAWSPDGRFIAFERQSAKSCAFYLISSAGGPERKIAEVYPYLPPTLGNSQYFSPDGKSIAVRDKSGPEEPSQINLVSIDKGEKRSLTSPPAGTVGDAYPAFSPDGKTLAFIRSTSLATNDIYLMPLAGGQPRRLTFDNTSILGLSWTADGNEIVFSSRRGSSIYSLWRIKVAGGVPERLLEIGQRAISPTISGHADRLAYTQMVDDENIWRLPLAAAGRSSVATPLISSTLSDDGPDFSPDGRKIVFASNRTGDFGIWVCDADGANPVQLVNRGPYLTGTPRWSPDGRWIAYDSRSSEPGREGNADIFVAGAAGGTPRQLTVDAAENVAPSWSRDGKWIYFGSSRGGGMQIWKVSLESDQTVQVTRQGGFEGFESVDGKFLYYAKGRSEAGIWRIPVTGGDEKLVLDHHQAGYWRLWNVIEGGIYFATASNPHQPVIEFFDFASRKVSQVIALTRPLPRSAPGLSVSPDRRWLLFTQMDQSGSDIMLVTGFR